jgi:hypothetical protein
MSCPPGALRSVVARHANWIEEEGGLPPYFERIACHLHFEKGRDIGTAIAIAVNVAKRMCATGDLNFPGRQNVNANSRREACAAVARWEAMKASAAAKRAKRAAA